MFRPISCRNIVNSNLFQGHRWRDHQEVRAERIQAGRYEDDAGNNEIQKGIGLLPINKAWFLPSK